MVLCKFFGSLSAEADFNLWSMNCDCEITDTFVYPSAIGKPCIVVFYETEEVDSCG